jgi:hypothetical protein
MIHHVPDLTAAARELRRVVRAGGPILIRSAFAGRHQAITLFRFFTCNRRLHRDLARTDPADDFAVAA